MQVSNFLFKEHTGTDFVQRPTELTKSRQKNRCHKSFSGTEKYHCKKKSDLFATTKNLVRGERWIPSHPEQNSEWEEGLQYNSRKKK